MIASFTFKTRASISFYLGKYSDELVLDDGFTISARNFKVLGWIEVHHPCYDHIKTQLICSLPADYHAWEKQNAIITTMLAILGIPADETYEARFFNTGDITLIEQADDRDGLTDRISS